MPHGAKKALLATADQLDWSFLGDMAQVRRHEHENGHAGMDVSMNIDEGMDVDVDAGMGINIGGDMNTNVNMNT
jgi:hypothetical protein